LALGYVVGIYNFVWVQGYEFIVYALGLAVFLWLLYVAYEGYRRWTWGGPKWKLMCWPPGYSVKEALYNFTKFALLQWKVLRQRFPGIMHAMIFYGIGWLFLATILRALNMHVVIFLTGNFYYAYKLLNNLAGLLVLVGASIAIVRRKLRLTPNLPQDPYYYLVLSLLIVIVVTGFLVDGIAVVAYRYLWERAWFDPIGYLVFLWARTVPLPTLQEIYRGLWLFHMSIAMATLAIIPYTNLWHIYAAAMNVTFQRRGTLPQGVKPVDDIDERIEKGKPLGVVKLSDTTWKQRMDFDACTSCMRCTNACPAYASGKVLSPRDVIVTLRDAMWSGLWDQQAWGEGRLQVNPEAVWSCVTCGACLYECPVTIHHVDTIIDMRRGMVSVGSEYVPKDALDALYRVQTVGNPLGANPAERDEWLAELAKKFGDDVVAREGEEYDYLYWVGCITSFDPRMRPVAESVIYLLKKAGLKVAVTPEHSCCGEPARSVGDEALYVELMKQSLTILSKYRFKRLLVSCPHGFNNFKNNYKLYRDYLAKRPETVELTKVLDRLDVEHHSVVLFRLLKEGKIRPSKTLQYVVTYHDPCYLGRWNGVYEEPREVIKATGLRLKEMPRNRSRSFCCGGGGGQMFYEVKRGTRIATMRAQEAANALGEPKGIVAVACPYCNTMFRAEAGNFGFEVKDIAELLREAVEDSENGGSTGQSS
jgi:Fe-S oxidoreductase/nitrate reductase gamma subunit